MFLSIFSCLSCNVIKHAIYWLIWLSLQEISKIFPSNWVLFSSFYCKKWTFPSCYSWSIMFVLLLNSYPRSIILPNLIYSMIFLRFFLTSPQSQSWRTDSASSIADRDIFWTIFKTSKDPQKKIIVSIVERKDSKKEPTVTVFKIEGESIEDWPLINSFKDVVRHPLTYIFKV